VIDVALTPAQSRPAEIAVVVDVLRATSTATQALAAGYRRVLCTDSIERALGLRGPGRVLAGERQCVMPEGFDQGNSPREAALARGDELVLATTNGAPAVTSAALQAQSVVLACMLNLDALLEMLRDVGTDIQIVCSGTDGHAALEDVYVAGRICAALAGPRTDAALIAEDVARSYPDPLPALEASADASVLRAAGLDEDIAYCAQESLLGIVPVASFEHEGIASVVAGGRKTVAIDSGGTVPAEP
jgi:2-phosphosulfolactate phosphatase